MFKMMLLIWTLTAHPQQEIEEVHGRNVICACPFLIFTVIPCQVFERLSHGLASVMLAQLNITMAVMTWQSNTNMSVNENKKENVNFYCSVEVADLSTMTLTVNRIMSLQCRCPMLVQCYLHTCPYVAFQMKQTLIPSIMPLYAS